MVSPWACNGNDVGSIMVRNCLSEVRDSNGVLNVLNSWYLPGSGFIECRTFHKELLPRPNSLFTQGTDSAIVLVEGRTIIL